MTDWISNARAVWRQSLGFSSKRSEDFRPRLSLAACLEQANDEVYVRSHGTIHNRAYKYIAGSSLVELLSEKLAQQFGLTQFDYVGCGDNAIVLRYSHDQALRLRAPADPDQINTHYVLEADFVCPIWKEFSFEGARLNFVPYIESLEARMRRNEFTNSEAEYLLQSLIQTGFQRDPTLWFYDYRNFKNKYEQIGLLGDHTPIILDQGSVIYAADAPEKWQGRLLHDERITTTNLPKGNLSWNGSWLDERGNPKILDLPQPGTRILDS